jgi:hypothetical protein
MGPYGQVTLVRVDGVNGVFRVARVGVALELQTFWMRAYRDDVP